jgi:hypothetical protein
MTSFFFRFSLDRELYLAAIAPPAYWPDWTAIDAFLRHLEDVSLSLGTPFLVEKVGASGRVLQFKDGSCRYITLDGIDGPPDLEAQLWTPLRREHFIYFDPEKCELRK